MVTRVCLKSAFFRTDCDIFYELKFGDPMSGSLQDYWCFAAFSRQSAIVPKAAFMI